MPTSRRSIVWNGCTVDDEPVVEYWPVTSGTFCPTMIRASSLSSVSSVGVDRMFAFASLDSARISRPRLLMTPRPGIVIEPLMMPRLSPCPRLPRLIDASTMLLAAAAHAEVRAADALARRCARVGARQHLPLDAELGGAIGRDLDDQRLDVDLRAPQRRASR
jgi:hypothetical protein